MALVKHLRNVGFTSRQAKAIGFSAFKQNSGATGTVIINYPVNIIDTQAAANNYVDLPTIDASTTGMHYIYNNAAARTLVVNCPTSHTFLSTTGPAGSSINLAAYAYGLFIAAEDTIAGVKYWGAVT